MLRDAVECCGMLRNAAGCCGMLWNAAGCCGMLRDAVECCGMLRDAVECGGMLRNAVECCGMLRNAASPAFFSVPRIRTASSSSGRMIGSVARGAGAGGWGGQGTFMGWSQQRQWDPFGWDPARRTSSDFAWAARVDSLMMPQLVPQWRLVGLVGLVGQLAKTRD